MDNVTRLSIDGMGIVFFSAETMKYVAPGTDFLTAEFTRPDQIAQHIKRGDITAFCTGSSGDYSLHFQSGYPSTGVEKEYPVSIRLGLEVRGGSVQFCDLFWLNRWNTDFPRNQVISMADGFYDVTVLTRLPESGYWGEGSDHTPVLSSDGGHAGVDLDRRTLSLYGGLTESASVTPALDGAGVFVTAGECPDAPGES